MGFDIECIVDIHTYPGEYFCPVCRTLVFPAEAIQSQCTHLYCKPCLSHVANGSRSCPYDGYLVTEADSKPLIESDKTLAENIGKVKVRCLYHRSGCTWEGPLSDCTSHCASCSFGNSPVICNRCGVQIVHRQVHEHAQTCSGVYPAQQAANGAQDNPSSGAATTATDPNQTTAQSATPATQAPNPQTAPAASLMPGQDPNQQTNASSQAAVAAAAVATSEQWYQQQYQQYYQQYGGYDPYQQQAYQQYYPYQQQPVQQYQQQPHVYMQPQMQPQTVVPSQPQSQPQPQPQPLNPQLPPPPPAQPQMQALPKGQTLPQAQALAQQHQNQVQVNAQQQLPSAMQPHTQNPSQTYPTSHVQPPTQPSPYPQSQTVQPHSQHQVQVPQYQQPHVQVHPPQSSQAQPHPFVQPQPYSQLQPQVNVTQSHGQLRPPQAGHPAHAQAQTVHSTASAVSGYHSYPAPQAMQQMPTGVAQQPPIRPHPSSGSMHPVQTHGQVPQQPPSMRPPQGLIANQQLGLVAPQGQASAQAQHYPTAQQAGYSNQQYPVHPNQQVASQQYSQQQALTGPFPSQSYQQGHYIHQQQPLQSQFRPQSPPNLLPQSSHAYNQPQQNVALPPAPQAQQPQAYMGRPGIQSHVQAISQAHGGYSSAVQVRPVELASTQPQLNPSYGNFISNEHEAMDQKKRPAVESHGDQLPDKSAGRSEVGVSSLDNAQKESSLAAKSIDAMAPRFEASINDEQKLRNTVDEYRQRANSGMNVHKGDSNELMDKKTVKEEGDENSLEPGSASKSADAAVKPENDVYDDGPKALDQSLAANASSDTANGSIENMNRGRNSHNTVIVREAFQQHVHEMPLPKYGLSAQPRPPGHMIIPSMPPPGRAHSQAAQPLNAGDHFMKQPGAMPVPVSAAPFGRGSGHFPPPGDFREGIMGMGRAPLGGPEIPNATHHSVNPTGAEMFQNQRANQFDGNQPNPGSFEKVPYGQTPPWDKRLKAPLGEHLSPLPVPHDQVSRLHDKPPRGFGYDSGSKLEGGVVVPPNRLLPAYHPPGLGLFKDSGEREPLGNHNDDTKRAGPGFGAHRADFMSARNADGEFFNIPPHGVGSRSGFDDIGGREPHHFIEAFRPFNSLSADGRFQPLPGHSHGSEIDGFGDLRGREHTAFGRPNHIHSGDPFGKDMPSHLKGVEHLDPQKLPSHLRFGESAGFGSLAGRGFMGEMSGPGDFPGFAGPIRHNKPGMPRLGEPGFRSRYPGPGFPNDGLFAGDMDSFDRPRKRNPISMGWCRICKVDCETVEGLDMHSQTREHQDMAIDMVRTIKEQNRKKQKTFSLRAAAEEKGKTRKTAFEGRGRKI